ncbi:hypothetical protein [Paraburkholderia nodosa]|uniref:hypothetical protein n=1 Tax=Paraburkholderia nodosa TaxID=392320 RepID=UPI00047FBD62|nr:hypothetical protein [Paraburkholderia nodosa]
MELQHIACGQWKLIADGIERFVQEYGRKPVTLLLHPAHAADFYRETEAGADDTLLNGISIVLHEQFALAALMDIEGRIYEL